MLSDRLEFQAHFRPLFVVVLLVSCIQASSFSSMIARVKTDVRVHRAGRMMSNHHTIQVVAFIISKAVGHVDVCAREHEVESRGNALKCCKKLRYSSQAAPALSGASWAFRTIAIARARLLLQGWNCKDKRVVARARGTSREERQATNAKSSGQVHRRLKGSRQPTNRPRGRQGSRSCGPR